MHFVPQVLIVANAWAAGFEHQNVETKATPPREIQARYNELRRSLKPEHREALAQIEANLVYLQNQLADIKLGSTSVIGKAAQTLLDEIDHGEVRSITWKTRIDNYSK